MNEWSYFCLASVCRVVFFENLLRNVVLLAACFAGFHIPHGVIISSYNGFLKTYIGFEKIAYHFILGCTYRIFCILWPFFFETRRWPLSQLRMFKSFGSISHVKDSEFIKIWMLTSSQFFFFFLRRDCLPLFTVFTRCIFMFCTFGSVFN